MSTFDINVLLNGRMTFLDLKLRVYALIRPHRVERDLDDELSFHLERETQKLVDSGLDPAEARTRALARFGSPALAADRCRDARGTSFVDALVRDVLYALRTFRRAPLAAFTIVTTVALGLALVAVVFTFYNALFLRADAVPNPGELFEVRRPPSPGANAWLPFTRPQYEVLRRETDVFTDAFAMLGDVGTRIEGRATRGALVTGNFFQVLGVNPALGRTLVPSDDERSADVPVMVLSHRGWTKLFAGEPAVGRKLLVNRVSYEVVGVMPPEFRGLGTAAPDFWAPLAAVGLLRPADAGNEDQLAIDIVGRLKPGVSPEAATAGLTAWASGSADLTAVGGQRKTIVLRPRQGTIAADAAEVLLVFAPIFFTFGLVLLIGCANVANLLLARGVSRQREIGIRLSLGASRSNVIRQLLTESLLLALVSAACALALSRLILDTAVYLAVSTMPPEIAEGVTLVVPDADWRVVAFLLAGAIASTAFFGLAPALQTTRLDLVRTMRGELTKDSGPARPRNALIAVQVGAAALLLICATVFLRSATAAATAAPGLRTGDTVMLRLASEPQRAAMLQAVTNDPSVAAIAASWPPVLSGTLATASTVAEVASGQAPEAPSRLPVEFKFVSPEYFGLLDIEVLRGRTFTAAERSAASGIVVVSATTARRLWPKADAVGQVLHLAPATARPGAGPPAGSSKGEATTPQLPARAFTVIGVVRDVRVGRGMFELTDAGVYVPIGPESPGTSLTLRVHGDPEQTRIQLMDRLTRVDPAIGMGTLRTVAGMGTYVLRIAFWVTAVLGGLALVLTLSGIFSVLSYIVEQRRQEIGVRMALGATTGHVAALMLTQSARPVAIGLVAGGALAGMLATVLMSTRAASQIGDLVRVFDPVAYAASLLCIVTACALAAAIPALRAARIDPMATLRQE
jgi:predicted permease